MMRKSVFRAWFGFVVCLALLLISAPSTALADWLKMDPPPDVDKTFHNHANASTCWLATAANMLAGAGYGNGATVQQRADAIYLQLVAHYSLGSGWTDTAVSWWLGSVHNTWPNNPYTVVTVYGNKIPKNPWANANGAQFIGNELRRCQIMGLSISWPVAGAQVGRGGHAITGWGDEGDSGDLTGNPAQVKVTDSDRDTGGNVQTYNYDAYNNPNPGGANEGNGWYIDYDPNHPYIKHIVTLCPTTETGYSTTVKVVESFRIHQDNATTDATDLHYRVGTDVDILSYRTTIDWSTGNSPSIIEVGRPPQELIVTWDLSDNPVPYCTWVTITTEFVLPSWNAIWYDDVYFTYPFGAGTPHPGLDWEIITPTAPDPDSLNVTGGYVIGSYEIYTFGGPPVLVSEHRIQHQYSYFQDPEVHQFRLESDTIETYMVVNPRFGHSYGFLTDDELWTFDEWLSTYADEILEFGYPVIIDISWEGLLPYPPGDDYIPADLDNDGDVDIDDYTLFGGCFTGEGVPVTDPDCISADLDLDGDVDCDDWDLFVEAWTGPPVDPPDLMECSCYKEGAPAFYADFGEGTHDVIAGETACWTVGPTNFGFVSASCPDTDTFCVWAYDTQGWVITGDPPLESCFILDPGYLWWQDICITVPCEVDICDYDTLTIVMSYCDAAITCRHDCIDLPECEDPNWYGGNPHYSSDQVVLHVVESPPALYIVQDSVYYIEQGQTAAYVPFTICNGDACADPTVYNYVISNTGHIDTGFPQAGSTTPVPGGECQDVYGIVDAGIAVVCDYDTLTIVAWDAATGTVYDTCVQIIHVVAPEPVPLFTAPVVTIMVLAMILAGALIMKRRITGKA